MFKKIYIEITNICNLKCKFCPDTKRQKSFMDVEQFEQIIQKIYQHTKLVCLHVKGEPLLHDKLKDILEIIDKYDLKANITTNGTLINEKINILSDSKAVRQINFSLHSMLQNDITNEKYLQNIFKCVDKLDNIIVSYRLWNLSNINKNTVNNNIIKEIEKYYNMQNLANKLIECDFLKLKPNVYINQDMEFTWPNIEGKEILQKGKCLALKDQIAILVDGTVVPCCLDNDGDIPIGNILEESLEEILQKEQVINIKKNFENNIITCKLCKTCGFLERLENKRKKEKCYEKQ